MSLLQEIELFKSGQFWPFVLVRESQRNQTENLESSRNCGKVEFKPGPRLSNPTYRKRTSGARTEKLLLGERKPTSRNNNSGENSLPALRLGSSEHSIWANCLFKSKLSVYVYSISDPLTLCFVEADKNRTAFALLLFLKIIKQSTLGTRELFLARWDVSVSDVGRQIFGRNHRSCASKTLTVFKDSRFL